MKKRIIVLCFFMMIRFLKKGAFNTEDSNSPPSPAGLIWNLSLNLINSLIVFLVIFSPNHVSSNGYAWWKVNLDSPSANGGELRIYSVSRKLIGSIYAGANAMALWAPGSLGRSFYFVGAAFADGPTIHKRVLHGC